MENNIPCWLETARFYVGKIKEITSNRSPEIDMFNKLIKVPLASPWCAAFVAYCLSVNNVLQPKCEASALMYYHRGYKDYSALEVIEGKKKVKQGDIVIFRRGKGWTGHCGFANEDWEGVEGETIEGNTSSDDKGSQYNGDGVYIRERKIIPTNNFRIIGFSKVLIGD